MKIVILDGYTENPGDLSWNGFEALGEVTVYDRTPFADGSGEIVRRAKGADILIVNKTPLSAETLAKLAPELRYIGVLATGYNVVDTAAAKAQGVPVCNIPTYGTAAVAQFVMALLLELCHHVGDHSRSVKEGGWSSCPDFCYWNTPLIELAGKTFGVIGYGRIGRAAARRYRDEPAGRRARHFRDALWRTLPNRSITVSRTCSMSTGISRRTSTAACWE